MSNANAPTALWREYFAESQTSPFHAFDRNFPTVFPGYPAKPTLERQEHTTDPEKHNPDNFFFKHNDVAFFGLNEVNSNRAPFWQGQNAQNEAWLEAKLGTGEHADCSIDSLVFFTQRDLRTGVRDVLSNYFDECGEKPVLNLTGDIHPFVHCSNTNTDNNILKIVVEAFKAAPLLVSIVKDPTDGKHYFHTQSTSTTTTYGECASFDP